MSSKVSTPEDRLAEIDLFADLSHRQLKKLVNMARTVSHPAGKSIATEGLGGMAFHLILEGEAAVTTGAKELRTLKAGDHFGEISMIDGRPRSASVDAKEGLVTLAVPHAVFTSLIEDDPAFAKGLLLTLCARLREAEARH